MLLPLLFFFRAQTYFHVLCADTVSSFVFFLLACRACQAGRPFSLHRPPSLLLLSSSSSKLRVFQLCFSLRDRHLHLKNKKKKSMLLLALVSFVAAIRGTSKGNRDRTAAAAYAVLNTQYRNATQRACGRTRVRFFFKFIYFVVHSVSLYSPLPCPLLVSFCRNRSLSLPLLMRGPLLPLTKISKNLNQTRNTTAAGAGVRAVRHTTLVVAGAATAENEDD